MLRGSRFLNIWPLTGLVLDDQGSSGGRRSARSRSIYSFYSELVFTSLQVKDISTESAACSAQSTLQNAMFFYVTIQL